jgi:PDZ domain
MSSFRVLLAGLVVAVMMAGLGRTGQNDSSTGSAKKTSEKEIAALIAQLSDDKYQVREQATKKLMELDEALPALRRALERAHLEHQRRLNRIIAAIQTRLAARFIAEAVTPVNEEGIDLFLDRMVLLKAFADEHWPAALKLAMAMAKRAESVGGPVPTFKNRDFLALPVVSSFDNNVSISQRVLVSGVAERIDILHDCFLISSGSLEEINSTNGSILLVNGDIDKLNSTQNSIIFCNGTIRDFNSTTNCLIFITGLIERMNFTQNNTIFVRGELASLNYTKDNVIEATRLGRCNLSQGNTYLNCKAPPQGEYDRLAKADPSPLDLFKYFDPARDGLTFNMVNGDAQVVGVIDGKPYAQAGLKKGDLILAVDQAKFMTQNGFVGLLRRQVVTGEALLKVQRADRVLNIPLRFGDQHRGPKIHDRR